MAVNSVRHGYLCNLRILSVLLVLSTFKRGGCDTLAIWRKLKSGRLSSTSVRKECLPNFTDTLGKKSSYMAPLDVFFSSDYL